MPDLLKILECPICRGELTFNDDPELFKCIHCEYVISSENKIPLFTEPPSDLNPSEKLARGPDTGTPWRRANWRFLEEQLSKIDHRATILDVGAGRGDFSAAFSNRPCIALDIYPYPEVDIVCDLTRVNPFRHASFDAIFLLNVLEHVYDAPTLLNVLRETLKPGGVLVVAIPFMVKIHQAPIDYLRFTQYALEHLGNENNLETVHLEGYYDPIFFLEEGIGNLQNAYLPTLSGNRRHYARILLSSIKNLANLLRSAIGDGACQPPNQVRSKAPTGYHVVYRKPL